MTKHALVREVAKVAGLTLSAAEDAVNAVRDAIVTAVNGPGGRFEFRDFGTFTKVQRKARTAVNRFGGGGTVQVPAKNTVRFKPSPAFKAALN